MLVNKKNQAPLVSIIICFYNEEKYLQEAIDSVFAQTLDDWELFLVDDGSSDMSTDIAAKLADKHNNKKVVYLEHSNHQNKGLSASRNLGIQRGRGQYCAFLDADDVWLPQKLLEQLNILKAHPEAVMVCGASKYWYSWNNSGEKDVVKHVGGAQNAVNYPPSLLLSLYPLGEANAPCPSGIFIKRSAVEAVGGFEVHFSGYYQLYEDQGFLSKIYLRFPVYVAHRHYDLYRQRKESIVSTVHQTGNYHTVREYYLRWFNQYLSDNQNIEVLKKVVNKALIPYDQTMAKKIKNRLWRVRDIIITILKKTKIPAII